MKRRKATRAAGSPEPAAQGRDAGGRYGFLPERLCRCGHRYEEHTEIRARDAAGNLYQPCCADSCFCPCFRAAREKTT